jgi:hypothetical protein
MSLADGKIAVHIENYTKCEELQRVMRKNIFTA